MMVCPKCTEKVPARNTKRAKNHVYRNYYCRCGKSFATQEKITKVWDRINPMPLKRSLSGDAARIAEVFKTQRAQRAAK